MDISVLIVYLLTLIWSILSGRRPNGRRFSMTEENLPILVIEANPEAKRLYEELIKVRAYNKLIRPVKNNSEKTDCLSWPSTNSITRCRMFLFKHIGKDL